MKGIKKTENTMNEFVLKTRLLFGKPVEIGKRYDGLIPLVSEGISYNDKLVALCYEDGQLLLTNENRTYFAFFDGDFAVWDEKIIAEAHTSITFNQAITKETDFRDLRERYYRVPKAMINLIQRNI